MAARDAGTAVVERQVGTHGHDEYGWTGTRADGLFDLVVNGGGWLTVEYQKDGYLPVQRKIEADWSSFASLDAVIMLPLDVLVSEITADSAEVQVARGSVVEDTDGTRQATLLFPPNTTISMTLPDGSEVPLSDLHVRATEYTVGADGKSAMPGELPPTSGYTYAVGLTVDEAIAAGARSVTFSNPVPVYVDNFLGFPVGGPCPRRTTTSNSPHGYRQTTDVSSASCQSTEAAPHWT